MVTLLDVLQISEFQILSDSAAKTYGDELITQKSNKLWAWSDLIKDVRFGKALADKIYNLVLIVDGVPAAMQYVNYGMDLSLPDVQLGLTMIASQEPNNTELQTACSTLKSLGVWQVTRWKSFGLESPLPQLADITEARRQLVNLQRKNYIRQQYLNAAMDDPAVDMATIQALVADNSKWGV